MNRTLFFVVLLCMSLAISAQNIPTVECSQKGKIEKVIYQIPDKTVNPFMNYDVNMVSNKGMLSPFEVELGETYYDLQTNGCIDNRFKVWDDGTMAAVWTRGLDDAAFTDRGTGYNFFDGSDWGPWPTERLEDRRCGWPSLAAWGETGEIVVAHNGVEGLEWSQREVKGEGDWTQTNFLGPAGIEDDITWPRMITSGENNDYIHLFVSSYNAYMGQERAILYSRSNDGGVSWDPHNIVLDGLGDDYYFEIEADAYTMAAKGNTVCFLIGSAWMDLVYMRSDDNGDTWDKHIVWEHPYPFFDPATMLADTFFCVDGSAQLTLDNAGHAHVVFGIQRAIADESSYGLYVFNPDYDGIGYWNDMMEPFSNDLDALAPPDLGYENSEMIEDVNYIGWMQDVDGDGVVTLEGIMNYHTPGMSTMPTITVDDNGIRYLIFASNTETYVYIGGAEPVNYKHIWSRMYSGSEWGDFYDLTIDISHIFDECIYPLAGKVTGDGFMHYIFNVDISPGNAFNGNHEWQQNRIIYGKLDIVTGIEESRIDFDNLSIELNPNPAIDRVQVKVDLETGSQVHVSLTNITGQMVREVNRDNITAGTVNIDINVSDLPAGTYICIVKADNAIATKKLIVR